MTLVNAFFSDAFFQTLFLTLFLSTFQLSYLVILYCRKQFYC